MSKLFKSIETGLEEAIGFAKGKTDEAVVTHYSSLEVKEIREKTGLSQDEFAKKFGINVSTLRHWELGERTPHGPALTLLNVIAKEAKAVLRALR